LVGKKKFTAKDRKKQFSVDRTHTQLLIGLCVFLFSLGFSSLGQMSDKAL
jgi:hypothetical protein